MVHNGFRLPALATVLLSLGYFLCPHASLAHPLGNFSISHYTGLRVEQGMVELRYLLDMAEIPTFQEIQETGIVPQVGHPSLSGYLTRQTERLQEGLLLEVNGRRLPLQGVASEVFFPPGAGGLPTLKLGLLYRAMLDPTSTDEPHQLHYRDSNFPGRPGWQEIIAAAGPGVALVRSSVPTIDHSRALTDYSTELLNSPPQVLEAQVLFTRGSPHQVVAAPRASASSSPPPVLPRGASKQATPRSAFTELVSTQQLSLGMVCLALAVAAGLGAFHALEPGHGKTVVAAYLVGTRGTARHALYLGLIVTATHTAGVYVLGAVTLYASHYVVPERLYPWLGILSGLAITGLGCGLLLRRYAGGGAVHTHSHTPIPAYAPDHAHVHSHAPVRHGHAHVLQHSHHPHAADAHQPHDPHKSGEMVSWRDLLALGVTGGMVPCPAALVVLLSAVSLRRVGLGLLLILAFSIGLAGVLIGFGLLLGYARGWFGRANSGCGRVPRLRSVASALVIVSAGAFITIQAVPGGF